ncbi:hypothetical protein B296_00022241 [Ensete ventricosum]|uniref:Uncharacterized protein n=1 Tax=Ensete ventricosum TaxID=4639 RepID=A0A427ADM4_ENSVE|nr:hypothetical protein B296_00022241 [Ensete ventricosum]
MMADPNIREEDPRCWAFGQQRVFRQQDGNLWTVQRSISEAAQRSGHDMLPLPASLARLLALSTPLTAVRSCFFHDGNHLASEEKKSCEEIGCGRQRFDAPLLRALVLSGDLVPPRRWCSLAAVDTSACVDDVSRAPTRRPSFIRDNSYVCWKELGNGSRIGVYIVKEDKY